MTSQSLYDQLRELRLSSFCNALREQQANPQYNDLPFEDRLSLLVEAECLQRRENRVKRHIRTANFPIRAAVEEIDFSPSRGLDRRLILELAQSNWVASRHDLLVLGPTGAGKTFLVSALGVSAARCGFTVRYFRLSRLLHMLTLARQDGSYINLLRTLAKTKLLILDDWMRDTVSIQHAQDMLDILDDRFGHASTMIACQVPVTDWHLRIPDPTLADAILDRTVHGAYRIQLAGESQRKLRAKRSMPNT